MCFLCVLCGLLFMLCQNFNYKERYHETNHCNRSCYRFSVNDDGCAGMSDQQQRTMSGSLIGAAGGAGIAAIAGGNAGVGAAVGAVAGGLTGYIIGEKKKQQ